MSQDTAFILAEYAASMELKDIPASAVAATKRNIYDCLACAVGGSTAPGIAELTSLVKEWGGAPQATALVSGMRVPAQHAAMLNAAMIHARDYDDTHDAVLIHSGTTVVSAALAAAELSGTASGEDFLVGVTVGLDSVCRIAKSIIPGLIETGWIYTPLVGYFGATIAAGRTMRLTKEQLVSALGIAYSQASGNHQATRDSAQTKRIQPAFAAKGALLAVQMAKKGIRGAHNVFQGQDGFFRVYLNNRYRPEVITDRLGVEFEQEKLSYKPYPCCRATNFPIDAAIAAKKEWNLPADQIRHVEVRVNEHCYEVVCTPVDVRKAPKSDVQAQFSIPYTVAAGLLNGSVSLRDFTEEALRRKDVLDLAARIDGIIDEDLEREYKDQVSPAILRIETTDGRVLEKTVVKGLGSVENPMTKEDFEAKLNGCIAFSACPLAEGTAKRFSELMDNLEKLPSVDALVKTLSTNQ